ncbi:hypothetical protein J22TS1_51740 [Siminovitchia terrae]|nr:hypothetical protein J22TS1_51740 [Siminovitchia terrae]
MCEPTDISMPIGEEIFCLRAVRLFFLSAAARVSCWYLVVKKERLTTKHQHEERLASREGNTVTSLGSPFKNMEEDLLFELPKN